MSAPARCQHHWCRAVAAATLAVMSGQARDPAKAARLLDAALAVDTASVPCQHERFQSAVERAA